MEFPCWCPIPACIIALKVCTITKTSLVFLKIINLISCPSKTLNKLRQRSQWLIIETLDWTSWCQTSALPFLTVWPWPSHWTSLCSSFSPLSVGIVMASMSRLLWGVNEFWTERIWSSAWHAACSWECWPWSFRLCEKQCGGGVRVGAVEPDHQELSVLEPPFPVTWAALLSSVKRE